MLAPSSSQDRAKIARQESIDSTWRHYYRTGSSVHRERLVAHYMSGHVRIIVQRFHSRLPGHVEIDDLMQQAYFGLAESIDRFDPERETKFETFSGQRIRGALLDHLRRVDPVSRHSRQNEKSLREITERFRKRHGRTPTDRELQSTLELDDLAFKRFLKHARPPTTVALPARRSERDDDENVRLIEAFESTEEISPLATATDDDLKRWVLQGLPREEKLIVTLYYFEGLSLREVGITIGVSESRVSQKKDEIIRKIRSRLSRRGLGELLASA